MSSVWLPRFKFEKAELNWLLHLYLWDFNLTVSHRLLEPADLDLPKTETTLD